MDDVTPRISFIPVSSATPSLSCRTNASRICDCASSYRCRPLSTTQLSTEQERPTRRLIQDMPRLNLPHTPASYSVPSIPNYEERVHSTLPLCTRGLDPVPDNRIEVLPRPVHYLPSWHPLYYTEASPARMICFRNAPIIRVKPPTSGRTANAVRKQSCAFV